MDVKRDFLLQQLIRRKGNGMIKVVTGMRRSGKSYLLFRLFRQHLAESGIDSAHVVEIDLENFHNADLRNPENLLRHVESRMVDDGRYYLLFDEIQLLGRFEEVLNTLLKKGNADLYVTGSNARFLSKDVVTAFRGRGDEIRVRPFSFAEYRSARPGEPRERLLADYLQYGGLPQTFAMPDDRQKREYLAALFRNTYLVDIKERHGLRDDSDLEELVDVMASNIGGLSNPTKLQKTFASVKGSSLAVGTIKSYLELLEDAFLIERAVRYDVKGKKYVGTPAKYYFEDLGLRNARLNFRQVEAPHLMENLIYNELRLRGYSVDVGRVLLNGKNAAGVSERRELEVDFVCNRGYDRIYVQSAWAIDSAEKREQELRSLKAVKDAFPKVVIVGGAQPTYRDDDGVLLLNVFDFLSGEADTILRADS